MKTAMLAGAVLFATCLVGVAQQSQPKQPPGATPTPWVRPRLSGTATNSGRFALDEAKLRALFPKYPWTADQLGYLNDHLQGGDTCPAIVASLHPLVVSAYSIDLDAVILVQFPDALVTQNGIALGDHLIASWIYPSLPKPPSDIVLGPRNLGHFKNGHPLVADFFSDSVDKIANRKARVSAEEWDHVRVLTASAWNRANGRYRTSFPLETGLPPELVHEQP